MKTVRFQQIVATSGRPEIYLTWSARKDDAHLMKALKQCRVMTLHQTVRGSTKDYGTIGLQMDANAQILLFPRSLKKFSDRRVVGINYDAIGQPSPAALRKSTPASSARSKGRQKSSRSASAEDDDTEKITTFVTPSSEEKPAQPSGPPITWKEITQQIAKAKTAFKSTDYSDTAAIFQKLADTLRDG